MSDSVRIYYGKKFRLQANGYWVNWMPIHAQRWVWICVHGLPPSNMDVHHKDGDKGNNSIENLELLNRSDHLKRHWQEGRFDLEKRRKQLDEVRPMEWLKSEEGRKSISEKGKEVWKARKEKLIICEGCGKEAYFKRWARFCHKDCYMRWRHRMGLCK
jgi:hypothetical protein